MQVRPEKAIVIYEFEACPFCRRVRELVTYLDLEVCDWSRYPLNSRVSETFVVHRVGRVK